MATRCCCPPDTDSVQQSLRRGVGDGFGGVLDLSGREHDVLFHRQVREQVELLEHHADFLADFSQGFRVATLRGKLVTVHHQLAGLELFQAVNAADEGGFAGATGADNHHHFAGFNGQVNFLEDMQGTEVLVHALHLHDLCHGYLSFRQKPVRAALSGGARVRGRG